MSEAMNIRNRQPDIKKICTNALQDFLTLVIKSDWKNDFYQVCEKNCPKGEYKHIYSGAYKKISNDGLENYEITQMDITLIYSILKYNKNLLIYKPSSNTLESVRLLKDSRDFDGHSSTNESDEELYLEALLYLCKLQTFVNSVLEDYNIPNSEEMMKFYQKYMKCSSDLMLKIDDERFILFAKYREFQKDVDCILSMKNERKKHEFYQNAYDKYNIYRRYDHKDLLPLEFAAFAYENKIEEARYPAAQYFGYTNNLKKFKSMYDDIFESMSKDNAKVDKKVIDEFLDFLYLFFARRHMNDLNQIFQDTFKNVENLGFIIKQTTEGGGYSLVDNEDKAQSSDK